MSRPYYFYVTIYDEEDNLDSLIATDLLSGEFTNEMTTGVGTFEFTVPAVNGTGNVHTNIGNNYRADFSTNFNGTLRLLFSGRIQDFQTDVEGDRVTRTFSGKGRGEILERRFKRNKRWQNVPAEDFIAEIASDLGITYFSVDSDTTPETITVDTITYFDLLKKISDYWSDGSTQVMRDFGIDPNGILFWKTRPFRTTGVETITNLTNYTLKSSIINSKNNIRVLGASTAPHPVLMDDYTDSLTDWTAYSGTIALADAAATNPYPPKAGTYWIKCHVDASTKEAAFQRVIPRITTRSINKARFWFFLSGGITDISEFRLFTDNENYFYTKDGTLTKNPLTVFADISMGEKEEYDADENPNGVWMKTGTPNWYDINQIGFYIHQDSGATDMDVYIDKFFFYPEPWQYTTDAEDATNQTAYGEREAEYEDQNLFSAEECHKRQETLLYQQKDRVFRLDFTVPGNPNILLGDRLTITLPLDNLTAQPFDVVRTTHTFNNQGAYITKASCLSTSNTRRLPPLTPLETIQLNLKGTRDVTSSIYTRIVK